MRKSGIWRTMSSALRGANRAGRIDVPGFQSGDYGRRRKPGAASSKGVTRPARASCFMTT